MCVREREREREQAPGRCLPREEMEGAERPLLTAGSKRTSREQSHGCMLLVERPPLPCPRLLQFSGHAEAEATGRGGRRTWHGSDTTCTCPNNQEGLTITNLMETERLDRHRWKGTCMY